MHKINVILGLFTYQKEKSITKALHRIQVGQTKRHRFVLTHTFQLNSAVYGLILAFQHDFEAIDLFECSIFEVKWFLNKREETKAEENER